MPLPSLCLFFHPVQGSLVRPKPPHPIPPQATGYTVRGLLPSLVAMDFVRLWGKGEGGKGRGGRRGGVGEGVGGRRGLWGEAAFGLLPSLATAFAMMVGGDFMSRLQAGKRVWGGSWGGRGNTWLAALTGNSLCHDGGYGI